MYINESLALLLGSIVGVVILILVLRAFLFWIRLRRSEEWKSLDLSMKIQVSVAPVSLLLSSVAVVGSFYVGFVGTKISGESLQISKGQDNRNQLEFFVGKADQAFGLYSDLLLAISILYVDSMVPEDNDKLDTNFFVRRVQAVNDALKAIVRDDFVHFCYQKSALQKDSKLTYISDELEKLGKSSSRLDETLNLKNLTDTIGIFNLRSARIIKLSSHPGELSKELANIREINKLIKAKSNGMRAFMFLGNLLWIQMVEDHIALLGAAYLHDLVQSVPDGSFVQQCIVDRYQKGKTVIEGQEYRFRFDPEKVVSATLRIAIQDMDDFAKTGTNPYFVFLRK